MVRELAKAAESSRVKAGEYVVGFDATLREVNGRSKGDTRVELLFRVAEGPDTGTPLFMYLARPQQRHASRTDIGGARFRPRSHPGVQTLALGGSW